MTATAITDSFTRLERPAATPGLARDIRPAPPRRLPATFRALRHRNYRLYFVGQLVSVTGAWMQTTALMWLAFELTHQSMWPALTAAAQVLPALLLGAWGGVLADRWPKRTLIFLTQTGFMLLAFLLAALVLGGCGSPWSLVLVTAAGGLLQAVDLPARLAFVTDMAGRDDLMNAVALNSLLFNVARVLGPALAGPLLLWLGPGLCFLANGLSYLAVLWALARMDVHGLSPRREPGAADRAVGGALLGGFRYLAGRPALGFLVLLAGTMSFIGWPFLVLLPALARDTLRLNEAGYSHLLSGTGAGALAAALVVATIGSVTRWRRFIVTGVAIVLLALVGLSLSRTLPEAAGSCAALGFGLILLLTTGQSVVQLGAGDHNRGRVMAAWAMVLGGAAPLGNLLAGKVADWWGVSMTLCLLAVTGSTAALGLLAAVRLWKRPRPDAASVRCECG